MIFSPRRSPGAVATGATNYKPKWQSPIASPIHSSAHQSPMLRSPVSPYVQSPYIAPKLSPAHLNSTNSPSRFSRSSPSSNDQVPVVIII